MARIRITCEFETDSPQYPARAEEDLPFLRENLAELIGEGAKAALSDNVHTVASISERIKQAETEEERISLEVIKLYVLWANCDSCEVNRRIVKNMRVEILEPGPPRTEDYHEYEKGGSRERLFHRLLTTGQLPEEYPDDGST